jgi:hypothetical protein
MADQPKDSPTQPEQKTPGPGQSNQPELSPEDLKLARRRKLLKGLAAGVPAIITLQSGAALATSSNGNACVIENDGSKFTKIGGGAMTKRCLTAAAHTTGMNQWVYKKHTITANDIAVWGTGNTTGPGNANSWCLVYMTSGGSFEGAAPWGADVTAGAGTAAEITAEPAAGFYAVTTSCWTSFY